MRTETKTLVSAMYKLAETIQGGDGIANAAIAEAAQRLDEQNLRITQLETALNAINALNECMAMARKYRQLLDECLFALNALPMQRIPDGDGGDTYKLAEKIEALFKKTDQNANFWHWSGKWIDVNDKLPDFDINVLAVIDGNVTVASRFDEPDGWLWGMLYGVWDGDLHAAETVIDDHYQPTHWMPIPFPPNAMVTSPRLDDD
jgi:hypothetical protein